MPDDLSSIRINNGVGRMAKIFIKIFPPLKTIATTDPVCQEAFVSTNDVEVDCIVARLHPEIDQRRNIKATNTMLRDKFLLTAEHLCWHLAQKPIILDKIQAHSFLTLL